MAEHTHVSVATRRRRRGFSGFPWAMLLGALWAILPATARAGDVKVTLDERATAYASEAGLSPAAVEMQLSEELRNLFQIARLDQYLRSFADAHAFASRGMGADYASNFDAVML